jgi:hypothetical protein
MLPFQHPGIESRHLRHKPRHSKRTDRITLIGLNHRVEGTPERYPVPLFLRASLQGVRQLDDVRVDAYRTASSFIPK